jgi:DNA-binding transcriptional LysR family regulator
MDLVSLQVFLTVAREKSFSRAAHKLYRTQPAISISVRKLEDWVGQPLFVRGSRAGKLTEAGELLIEYAERMLNLKSEILKGVEDLQNLRGGKLSIGVNESSIHALLPVLARYREHYPDVKISIHRVLSRDVPHEVLNYRLDLGIISFIPQEEKLTATPFVRDDLAFVVYPRHRLAKSKSVDISELGDEIFIAHIVDSPHRTAVIQLFSKHNVPLRMPVDMPTIESIKRFVEMEMGVAIVPSMCAKMEVERGTLVDVKIKQLRLPRQLNLIYRRHDEISHATRALLRLVRPREPKTTDGRREDKVSAT